jgi:putative copper resistance protein D
MWVSGPAVLLIAAFAAMLWGLSVGGAADALPLVDPGALVRYGLLVSKLLVNLGAAGAIGALAIAVFALSPREAAFGRALDVAAGSAAVWTVAAAASCFFVFQTVFAATPTLDAAYGDQLGSFLTQIPIGRAWLSVTLAAALVTVLCFAVRNVTALGVVAAFAVTVGLVPLAQQGHAGDTATHDQAITAIWLHVAFAALWLGGLLVIVVLRRFLEAERLGQVLPRYSTIALISFIVVAASGYLSAAIRVGELDRLLTPYGLLVLVKVGALLVLGLFGAFLRSNLIGRIRTRGTPGPFWTLVTVELVFMGIAAGVATALARTTPPVVEVPTTDLAAPTPAEYLTGKPLPPELLPARYLTEWSIDLLWLLVCAFGIFFYLAGVVRMRRRGDRWPVYRTVLWVSGMLLLFWVTNGAVNVYEQFLFSTHMLGHMILTMAVPALLVLSAPVTLALRAIAKRTDGSRGAREWIMLLVHSKFATFITNPIVTGVLFASSLWVFYYTPLFRWATYDHVGHTWMVLHFLIVGYLFIQTLVGVDPVPGRPSYPLRLVLLLATMAFHAFFGLALMTGEGLLLSDWYGAMGRTWGLPPLQDQQAAGGVAWSIGEIPTVALAIIVAIQWNRSDTRDARRLDRAADRDGDSELTAYNEMLAKRAERR